MGFVDAPNRVPEHQKFYQSAYKQHTRLWRIGTRSNVMFLPYQAVLWGTFSATLYMMGRKAAGYNTWFGKN